ncbi:DUF4160 domain-containing protein [Mesorhizobium sp. WSM4983]|uniref:DUF4160 domain-containing protein n=1 Tax=Mesorhizobium sp. WSM4983 TaxID=3038540 RepID=UPI003FA5E893
MPTVHRIGAHKIQLYPGDHAPPHFHVRAGGCCSYVVSLETLEITRGKACGSHSEIIAWAAQNMALLMQKWSELNERD